MSACDPKRTLAALLIRRTEVVRIVATRAIGATLALYRCEPALERATVPNMRRAQAANRIRF